MGIKFVCPNGHKLNVKSFLAGKRGICPHCDAKFRIPMESGGMAALLTKGDEDDAEQLSGAQLPGGGAVATVAVAPAGVVAAQPAQAVSGTATTWPAAAFSGTPTAFSGTGFSGAPTGAPAGGLRDPLVESPAAIWYVRPRSGGQFGPANGEVMRTWLAEGRVGSDSLVWREGWPEWRVAASVFPQLATSAASPGGSVAATAVYPGSMPTGTLPSGFVPATSATVPIGGLPAGNLPTGMLPAGGLPLGGSLPGGAPASGASGALSARHAARRSSENLTAVVVVLLVLIALVLAVVFAYILMSQPPSEGDKSPRNARAAIEWRSARDSTPPAFFSPPCSISNWAFNDWKPS